MKLLLDECIPRKFKNHLPGHECHTVPEIGLAGRKNGELLSVAEKEGFEAFLTIDRGIEYEQNLSQRHIAVILIRSKSSQLVDLMPRVTGILAALSSVQPGQLVRIG